MKISTRFYYHEYFYEATYVTILGDYCCPYSMDYWYSKQLSHCPTLPKPGDPKKKKRPGIVTHQASVPK